jgi:hypothetical protein
MADLTTAVSVSGGDLLAGLLAGLVIGTREVSGVVPVDTVGVWSYGASSGLAVSQGAIPDGFWPVVVPLNWLPVVAPVVVVPDPVVLPASWLAVPITGAYICPMVAQVALMRGAVPLYDAGRLTIGGAVLIGRAGGVFGFASVATAMRWVAIAKDKAGLELAVFYGLDPVEAASWRAERASVLLAYAGQVLARAMDQADAAMRLALVAESNFAQSKWG